MPLEERYRGQAWGCPTVTASWALVDLARTAPRPQALVIADSVLAGGVSKAALRRVAATMQRWPGMANAMWIIEQANGRSESALETLGRLACMEYDVPIPLTNVWLGRDHPMYRVDHLWPWHGVVAEGDGAIKYRQANDPAAVVKDEKERQWYIERNLGLDVVRYGWDLAFHDRRSLADRFGMVLRANPQRREPVRYWDTSRIV